MTPDSSDDQRDDEPQWHERTSTVVGASVGALAVLGLLWLVISYVAGGSDDPDPASQYYLDPSVSSSNSVRHYYTVRNVHRDHHQHQSAGHHRHQSR